MLDKQEAFAFSRELSTSGPQKLELAKLKFDTFLDYYLPESPIEMPPRISCAWTITTSRF